MMQTLECVALAGPTASGKTAAAMAIAARVPCEIISVDSALVYRGMDIGTAKPGVAELQSVPHHLIDIRDPLQPYNAAQFVDDCQALIGQIRARGKLPLLVGGTMLYFNTLLQGIDAMPGANPQLRATIEDQAAQRGWAALHTQLAQVDPASAARLAPQDSQRIGRALEVFQLTGLPLSHFHHREGKSAERKASFALISLEPDNRAWLHARIAERFDGMLARGFLDEVRALRARGDLEPTLPSMRCVGYRQAWAALDGQIPMHELRERAIFATRQLAKRQITWLRSMPQRHLVACDQDDASLKVMAQVENILRSPPFHRGPAT
jgi:tRNA dimethylallyltransferase